MVTSLGFRLLTIFVLSSAEWINSPRYGSDYVGGFIVADESSTRTVRCTPCNDYRSKSGNLVDEYRGNGADNLGYDWSPKAWGGIAFPDKSRSNRQNSDWPDDRGDGGRGGRQMPGNWNGGGKCPSCTGWNRDNDRPGDWDNRYDDDRRNWRSTTPRPDDWSRQTTPPNRGTTVTSSVIGIRHNNDKRMPVEWQGDGRSMRWDGFRNGVPLEIPQQTQMDRRNWNDDRPWDYSGKGASDWDDRGKGHYASSWGYGSPASHGWSDAKWNRPWSSSDQRGSNDRGYGQSGSLPFGSSYPQSSNYPSYERPSYSQSSWSQSTTPRNTYYYPSVRPPQQYPDVNSPRPSYEVTPRPGYQTTSAYPTSRPGYRPQDGGSWNYDGSQPSGQWTTPRPSQSYLPESPRPPSRPSYEQDRPPSGVPSITIWNGKPNDYGGSKPQSKPGYYTGFITEIHDSNNVGGNRYPGDRYPNYSNNDRYPSGGNDRYPVTSDRYPTNSNRYPSTSNSWYPNDRDRHPAIGGSQYPYNDRDRYPSSDGNRYPGSDRYPSSDGNRYPGSDRYPSSDGNRYPGSDRYPSTDGNKYPTYESSSKPFGNRYDIPSDSNRYPVQRPDDRYPTYNSDRFRPNYDNSYPSHDNKYPDRDRYPTTDRYPSYEYDRNPGYDKDRYPNNHNNYDKDRYPNNPNYDKDRYHPNRPGSSDYDRGPNPGSDSGSWNYGEQDETKDGTYRRSGGSYPSYKGGKVYTSSYLASASTPASSHELEGKKPSSDETTPSSQEQ